MRHGAAVHLTARRLKLGQDLFRRHGGQVVFFGRFVAVLRTLAAFFAGVNCMQWERFLLFNAAGGTVWAMAYGLAAYRFGQAITQLAEPIGIAMLATAIALLVAGVRFLRKHEDRLADEAERQFPGPLRS